MSFDSSNNSNNIPTNPQDSAGIILLDRSKTHCLMVKEKYSGKWGHTKGKIMEGETPLQGALRECEEEIDVTGIDPSFLCCHHLKDGRKLHMFVQFTEWSSDQSVYKLHSHNEIDEIAWV